MYQNPSLQTQQANVLANLMLQQQRPQQGHRSTGGSALSQNEIAQWLETIRNLKRPAAFRTSGAASAPSEGFNPQGALRQLPMQQTHPAPASNTAPQGALRDQRLKYLEDAVRLLIQQPDQTKYQQVFAEARQLGLL